MLNYVSSTDTATEMLKWEEQRPVMCLYLVQKSRGTRAGALHTTHQSVNCHLLFSVSSFQIIYSLIFHNKHVLIARKYIVFIKRAVLIRWLVQSFIHTDWVWVICQVSCVSWLLKFYLLKTPISLTGVSLQLHEFKVLLTKPFVLPFSWPRCHPVSQHKTVSTSSHSLVIHPLEIVASPISSCLPSAPRGPRWYCWWQIASKSEHLTHILPTSWLSGHEMSFSDSVLPDTQTRKYCLVGIKWVASWWRPKIANNSEHLFAMVVFAFGSVCSPDPSTVSQPESHWISRNLSIGCPEVQLPVPVSCLLGFPIKILSKAHKQIY